MRHFGLLMLAAAAPSWAAAAPRSCLSGVPIASFRLLVAPQAGEPRPLRSVCRVPSGSRLLYRPVELPGERKKTRVAAVAMSGEQVTVLESRPAAAPAEWTLPARATVVALLFGPQGLETKKVASLVRRDPALLAELADYAEKTEKTEQLLDALAAPQGANASGSLDAALRGFGAVYGLSITRLDTTAPAGHQAQLLLKGLNPALAGYDPLAPEPRLRVQQSAGLVASVASLFFGSPVGLAAGGAAVLVNLRSMMFPNTEFRSVLSPPGGDVSMCARRETAKARTRLAYIWATRLPDAPEPALKLNGRQLAPAGLKSALPANTDAGTWKWLDRVHGWTLEPGAHPVAVRPLPESQALELDLKDFRGPAGTYRLAGRWDWTRFVADGEVEVVPLADFSAAAPTPESADRLVAGKGLATVELSGADFRLVRKLELKKAGDRSALPLPLEFKSGERLEFEVDTRPLEPGPYTLLLSQAGGPAQQKLLRVLPPDPVPEGIPMRVNTGESRQHLVLRGRGLERVLRVESRPGETELISGGPAPVIEVRLSSETRVGDRLDLLLGVEGKTAPVRIPGALRVAGPRPRILQTQLSPPAEVPVELRPGELVSGFVHGILIRASMPLSNGVVHLACAEPGMTSRRQTIHAARHAAGENAAFVSLDPGMVGLPGCTLAATLETGEEGAGDPCPLGRVIRAPRISGFRITTERTGESIWGGWIEGQDLDTIEKTGWDASAGLPVAGLPEPVGAQPQVQRLRVNVSWPSPSPHAPLYVWLRGETAGRTTQVRP